MVKKYILAAFSVCLSFILSLLLMVGIIKIDILEVKMVIFMGIFFSFLIIGSLLSYFSRNFKIYNIGVFVSFLLNIVLIYNICDLNDKYDYIRDIFNDCKYVTYNVYVQRKTVTYDKINKLDGKKIGVLKESFLNVTNNLQDSLDAEFVVYNDIFEIESAILNGEIQSFILTEDELLNANEMKVNVMKKVRVIYTNKYKDSI